ncbi:MAG: hypothetical protein ACYTEX_27305, partial [Planctomycetota bacterium]
EHGREWCETITQSASDAETRASWVTQHGDAAYAVVAEMIPKWRYEKHRDSAQEVQESTPEAEVEVKEIEASSEAIHETPPQGEEGEG